jgi:hypothetical protein
MKKKQTITHAHETQKNKITRKKKQTTRDSDLISYLKKKRPVNVNNFELKPNWT